MSSRLSVSDCRIGTRKANGRLAKDNVFGISRTFFHVSGSPRISATGIPSSAPHDVAFQLDPMSRLMTVDGPRIGCLGSLRAVS